MGWVEVAELVVSEAKEAPATSEARAAWASLHRSPVRACSTEEAEAGRAEAATVVPAVTAAGVMVV